jgi:hypothetical protein
MWIRLIDNSNPLEPRVFEYLEGVLSTCDYRITNNGKINITLNKDGFSVDSNLENAMIALMSKDYFDVELYSGTTIVKSVKCRITSYHMGSGEGGNLRERAELVVLVEGIDYNFVPPVVTEAIYNVQEKALTVLANNLVQDENGAFRFDPSKMSVYGVPLNQSSLVKVAQKTAFTIQISEEDFINIENARSLGANAVFKTLLGWNSNRATGVETVLRAINVPSIAQVVTESGSTEGLSS